MIEADHITLTGTTVTELQLVTPGPNLTVINAAGAAPLWVTYRFGASPVAPVAYAADTMRVPPGAARDIDLPATTATLFVQVLGNGNEVTVERRL
jgi:hypothetical protein